MKQSSRPEVIICLRLVLNRDEIRRFDILPPQNLVSVRVTPSQNLTRDVLLVSLRRELTVFSMPWILHSIPGRLLRNAFAEPRLQFPLNVPCSAQQEQGGCAAASLPELRKQLQPRLPARAGCTSAGNFRHTPTLPGPRRARTITLQ